MSIDLKSLSPAPFGVSSSGRTVVVIGDDGQPAKRGMRSAGDMFPLVAKVFSCTDAEFFALARNAYDVMMETGWTVLRVSYDDGIYGWRVDGTAHPYHRGTFGEWCHLNIFPCPFEALIAARAWYRGNVEAKGATP